MRILFVSFADNIHTLRWVSQVLDQKWGLYLFPNHNRQTILPLLKKNLKVIKPSFFSLLRYYCLKFINQLAGKNDSNEKNKSSVYSTGKA